MKLLKFEEKVSNTHYQQKTIKSLLNAFNKDSSVFRNIKTTINTTTSSSNVITLLTPSTPSAPNSKCLQNRIDDASKSLNVVVNNDDTINRYNCLGCNRTYNDPEKLKRHVNNTHKKEKKFECNVCNKK
jgi:hypothetical protein